MRLSRRAALAAAALPRPAGAQADRRPTLAIAVQRLSNPNTLEPPREQSNAGFRIHHIHAERLIETDRLRPETWSTEDLAPRRDRFLRILEILKRGDPAHIVLHRAASFTAKRRDIAWRAARGWAMDVRAGNLRFGA